MGDASCQERHEETSADHRCHEEIAGIVLVTGATGFIGRRLVAALEARQEVAIRVLTRDAAKARALWSSNTVAVAKADLGVPQTIGDACSGVQTLFHLAGYAHAEDEGSPAADALHEGVTVAGTEALLDAALHAGVPRVVFVSSVKAMGEGSSECLDECAEPKPMGAYGRAKRKAECLVLETGRRHNFHACVLRLPLVYGSGVKGNLWRMMQAIKRGRFPPLPETGNKRSMVHVDDVARAALLTAETSQANGQTYIVTDGRVYSSRAIYTSLCRALGKSVPRWAIPASIILLMARAGDVINNIGGRRFVFDSSAAQKLLGSAWYNSQKIENELAFRPTRTLDNSVGEMVTEYNRAQELWIKD